MRRACASEAPPAPNSGGARSLLLLFLLLLPGVAVAGTPVPVHFTAAASPNPARVGEVVTVTVKAAVDAGWHIYSVVPAPNGPSATQIASLGNWTPLGPTTEDAPVQKFDANFGATVGYHEGAAAFVRAFRVPSGAASAPPSLQFHYQTCNARICLPPTDVSLAVPLKVAAGAARAAFVTAPSPTPPPADGERGKKLILPLSLSEGGGVGEGAASALLPFLLAANGAGLLAILTPCVFPLIPITLTAFVKQADGSKAKLVRLSGGYALGIVALYVGLGLVVALTLGAAGANRIAANPYVNLAEFVLFLVFALSFFEAIQIRLPGNLGALQQAGRAKGGTAGLTLLGVAFVLGSFTCTAPFVGTLLVAAANGSLARPLLGMTVFALAFVSPFLVFAAFPQWIAKIPKGGAWLTRVKGTLGFVEMAAALKFLSNADQVWQWKVLTQPVLLAAWAVIFVCAALYLWGTLRVGFDEGSPVSRTRRVSGAVFAAAAFYCFWGLAGRPLSPFVGAFLPPAGYGGMASAEDSRTLPWLTDYGAAFAQAKAEGKPLLIDFTGYTCTNCRLNEKNVFPRPAVQSAFARFVRVQLYTDGGPDGPRNQKLQQDKFGDVALPLYGIVDAQTGAVVDKTAGVQTPDGFAQFLARGQRPVASGSRFAADAKDTPPPPIIGGPGGPSASPSWLPYSPAAVQQAQAAGKPVLVDFTAKWCVNCKEIERTVFDAPGVSPILAQNFVTLRADLTQWGSPASVALQKQYGFDALPTVIFLGTDGKERRGLRVTGLLSAADFQHRMAQALAPSPTQTAAR